MALKTRKPTGVVPWPLILIEGGEKTGKGWQLAVLSASKKVGRTVIIDLNEGAWDEYGRIPGARFEIAEHDGTYAALMAVVADAKEEAAAARERGEKPFVLGIDGMTAEWDLLKDWAALRARTSASNRKKLERDPNAEVTIPMNIWNDVNARHRRLMTMLMTFPGIVVMTARGGNVAAVGDNGQPVEGKKTYRVEGNKNLGFDASCWLRVSREEKPVIVGARSVHIGGRPGIDPPKRLADDWTLEWLVFDALKCDPQTAAVRDLIEPKPDALTPEQIRDEALVPQTGHDRVQELYREAKRLGYDDVNIVHDNQDEEPLLKLLIRIGNEKKPRAENGSAPKLQSVPRQPAPALDPEDPWAVKVDGLDSAEDATAALVELLGLVGDEAIKADHAKRIETAILARFPQASVNAPEPPAATAEEDGETRFVRDFTTRLARAQDAKDETAFLGMRSELGRAVGAKKITPETANDLLADLNDRKAKAAA